MNGLLTFRYCGVCDQINGGKSGGILSETSLGFASGR